MKILIDNPQTFKPVYLHVLFETSDELEAIKVVCEFAEDIAQNIHDDELGADERIIYEILHNIGKKLEGRK